MFLNSVLEKAELICCLENVDLSMVEMHLVVVDRAHTCTLLRELTAHVSMQDNVCVTIDANDLEHLNSLSDVFADIFSAMKQLISVLCFAPTTVAENCYPVQRSPSSGQSRFQISAEVLEDLCGFH